MNADRKILVVEGVQNVRRFAKSPNRVEKKVDKNHALSSVVERPKCKAICQIAQQEENEKRPKTIRSRPFSSASYYIITQQDNHG